MLVSGCQSGSTFEESEEPDITLSVVSTASIRDRLQDVTIDSPAVGRTVQVRLLLPVAFEAEPDREWPVLWLLHGCCDTYDSWTRSTDIEAYPELGEVLVVMPEGGQVGFYSDWVDGPQWETFHTVELMGLLQERWRASDDQAIAGLSMGGLGAMAYAARHPGMFQAAASYSGVLHTGFEARAQGVQDLLAGFAEDPKALWGDPYSDEEMWAAHNPYDLAGELDGVALYVSSGDGTPGPLDGTGPSPDAQVIERDLAGESAAFADRLNELGIPVTYNAYSPGTHSWPYWEREFIASLPLLLGPLTTGA